MKVTPERLIMRRTAVVGWLTIFTQAALPLSFAYSPLVHAATSQDTASKWYQSGANGQNGQSIFENHGDSLASAGSALTEGNAAGMARSAATGAVNSSVEEWLSQFGTARVQLNLDDKFKAEGSEADLLVPVYEDKNNILFTQLGFRHKDERNTGNLGVGVRHFTGDWMLGANTFFDNDFTGENRRLGVGVEAWRDYLKLSANGYMRLSDWHQSRDFEDYDERPANGYDLRAEGWLPSFPQLGAKVMFEQYQGDEVALFGKDNRQKDPWAFTGGVAYTPIPLLTVGAQHRAGKDGQSDSQLSLQMNYRLGESWSKQVNPDLVGASRTLNGTRYDLVERNNSIVLDYRKQEVVKLLLPEKTSGKSRSTVPVTFEVQTKHALQRIDWDASALVAAGGSLTQVGSNQLSVTLPPYQAAGSNVYRFAGVAYDVKGNSGSATAEIHVDVGDVLPGATKVSANPTSLAADGKSTSTLSIALFDDQGNAVPGMVKSLSASIQESLAANQPSSRLAARAATVGPVEEASPGVYQAVITAGTRVGTAVVSSQFNGIALPDVTITESADAASGHIGSGAILTAVDNSVANNAAMNQVNATITDANGNPLTHTRVTFTLGGSATVAPGSSLSAMTDDKGMVSISLTDKVAETVTVTATLDNGNSGSVDTHFIADSSSAGMGSRDLTVDKTVVVANNADAATFSAVVKDANGNPVPNFSVSWTNDKGTLSAGSSSTDANGVATVTLKHTVAEAAQVVATTGNSGNVNAPVVNFSADSGSATIGSGDLSVDKTTLVANNVEVATYSAIVKDAGGNAVPNIAVAWKTDLGNLSGDASLTDANGQATVTLKGTQAGDAQVNASVNASAPVNANKVTFTADSSSATIGSGDVSVDKTILIADNADVATFSALVKDAHGNPVSNATVNWATSKGSLSGSSSSTGSDGRATITLKDALIGDAQVNAQTGTSGNINAPSVTFIADNASATIGSGDVTVDKTSIVADNVDMATYGALVKDANGNPVPNFVVNWATDKGTLSGDTTITNASGITTVTLKDTLVGTAQVTAQSGGSSAINAPAVNFTANSATGGIASGDLTADKTTIVADDADMATFTAIVKDANGNPVPNITVTWATDLGAVTPATSTTDGTGKATTQLKGTVAGNAQVTASVNGATPTNAPAVSLTASAASATVDSRDITVDKTTLTANDSEIATYSAIVKDANGNPVPNFTVNWTTDKGTLSGSTSATDANGLATITLKGTVAGVAQVVVKAGVSGNVNAPSVTFTPDSASATIGSGDLTVDKATVIANDTDFATYTALVKDAGGNPVPGVSVSWSTDLGTLSGAASTTGADGKATITLKGTAAGDAQVAASVNGSAPVDANKVTFTADSTSGTIGSGDLSVDKTTIVANDTEVATYNALVKDTHGNPVQNLRVNWATDHGTLSGASSNTGVDGIATITLKGTAIGLATVNATVNGTATPANAVTFIADVTTAKIDASNISVNKSSIDSDGVDSALYTVKVTDAHNNPVPALAVTFATNAGDLLPAATDTDSNGQITAALSANIPGGPSAPDVQANVNAQVNSTAAVNAPSVTLVIPAQTYTGPQLTFDTTENPSSATFSVTGRTGTISGNIKIRIKTNYPRFDIFWYTVTAPGGKKFELKKEKDGQTDIDDKTYIVDATGVAKSGTWRMDLDAGGAGTTKYTLDWEVVQ
ncbi:adhesin/invasin [Ewingella americana]